MKQVCFMYIIIFYYKFIFIARPQPGLAAYNSYCYSQNSSRWQETLRIAAVSGPSRDAAATGIDEPLEAIGEISHAENMEYSSDALSSRPATASQALLTNLGVCLRGVLY